ncbi:hypothetical protein BJ944DRAFT_96164 [Cunninghamella echinulata]|nr:hypothetical protein BJ944DRAFT_96164 [Cunninghamella echinulata]
MIWEKSGTYSKDVVEDIRKTLFGNDDHNNEQGSSAISSPPPASTSLSPPPPAIDTASILASLSSLNNGSNLTSLNLGNLIPPTNSSTPTTIVDGSNATTATTTTTTTAVTVGNNNSSSNSSNIAPVPIEKSLPDSVLNILNGFVSSKTEETSNTPVSSPPSSQQNSLPSSIPDLKAIQQSLQQQNNLLPSSSLPLQQQNNNYNNHGNNIGRTPPPSSSIRPPFIPPALPPNPSSSVQHSSTLPLPPPYLLPNAQYPMKDMNLPNGTIRVLTRTLFVGPLPLNYEREDVEKLFANYGKLIYVNMQRKVGCSAFVKLSSHQETRLLKYKTGVLNVKGLQTKVNWAFGFGPRNHFNFEAGESIIPLSELTNDEQTILSRSSIGGFHGAPITDKMTIEEPANNMKALERRKDDSRLINGYPNHHSNQSPPSSSPHLRQPHNYNNHNHNHSHNHKSYSNNNSHSHNLHYNNKRSLSYSNKNNDDDIHNDRHLQRHNHKPSPPQPYQQQHQQQHQHQQQQQQHNQKQQQYHQDDTKRKKSRFDDNWNSTHHRDQHNN